MIVNPATRRACEKIGYRLQVNQHAPEGYEGAYTLDCFSETHEMHSFDLGSKAARAREITKGLAAYLKKQIAKEVA